MPRRLLVLALLLAMETGCPHTWRKGGTIDMMVEKQMWENANSWKRPCLLTSAEWDERCKDLDLKPESERWSCPTECHPTNYQAR
jgi:hypothetical protein